MRYCFSLLFLGIIFVTCKNEQSVPLQTGLIGKWNLIRSCGGLIVDCYTPKSLNKKIVIEYAADSIFRRYINDTLKAESKFTIIKSKSIYGSDSASIIIYDYSPIRQSFSISHDTLFLNDECYDCYGSSYKRIQ